jgi:anionic cell wall polymer biosynthesis LytR-Cps2A-Psr (LCP) family protein
MRQRKNVPGGDFGRIKNQQNVIKGLMKKVTTTGVLTNPLTLDRLITTAAESLTVDKGMNLRDLAFALKGIDPANVKFATVPVRRHDDHRRRVVGPARHCRRGRALRGRPG